MVSMSAKDYKWHKEMQKYKKDVEKYNALPWYKKLFTKNPVQYSTISIDLGEFIIKK